MHGKLKGMVSRTMAARGLVNGRGPLRRSGRDSAKRVVSDTDTPKVLLDKGPDRTVLFVLCDKMNTSGLKWCIFMLKMT